MLQTYQILFSQAAPRFDHHPGCSLTDDPCVCNSVSRLTGVLQALSVLVQTFDIKSTAATAASSGGSHSAGDASKALSAALVGLSLLCEGDGASKEMLLSGGGMVKRLIKILKTSESRSRAHTFDFQQTAQ